VRNTTKWAWRGEFMCGSFRAFAADSITIEVDLLDLPDLRSRARSDAADPTRRLIPKTLRERRERMRDLEDEIKELLTGHRLSQEQLQGLQRGESDPETVRSLQRMLANTQNALLRLAREIDELRAR
jgi:hypothetical protein